MSIPRFWRLQEQNYRLTGQVCPQCGTAILSPRPLCPRCRPVIRTSNDQGQDGAALPLSMFDISLEEIRARVLVVMSRPDSEQD